METNLDAMSLKELKALQAQVVKAISTYEDRRKRDALAELEEKAREMGFSLAELTGTPAGRKRAAATPKYANPDNASDTWSGRGRKPRWFEAALKAGATADSMAI
ncbi:MAG: H-NS histone family protein [Cereibacter changlensis]|uniref:Transcriptional regulator n=3 Tax=Cereibacter changlensis TaxID=402884 RepID=A0A2T4JXQ4_9RHOB|nr:H-NS histone family protein [Cereibacter changlensis]MBZ4689602.1 histone family protein nucleoid-structuring protein [Cereibacter sp.]PTE22656.1 transcriptional regulator [Cereibacter changlensis JA139]PZX58963.1 DNA-binding protein H-NS [Cereibacter changlensis]TKA95591.1 H-NS histone family protein [Cereibacter changlensis]